MIWPLNWEIRPLQRIRLRPNPLLVLSLVCVFTVCVLFLEGIKAWHLSRAVYPAEAIVVLLDVSNSMIVDAYPEEEVVVLPAPGHIRFRCSSLRSEFMAEVPAGAMCSVARVLCAMNPPLV